MIKLNNITQPYEEIDYEGIQYSVCVDFNHISRYRNLRQVIHNPRNINTRLNMLETTNPFITHLSVKYYTVPSTEVNRLDVIANKLLGSATYSWVLAYFNRIMDGFTVKEGTKLIYPTSVTDLFQNGEILAPINPTTLNLGEE